MFPSLGLMFVLGEFKKESNRDTFKTLKQLKKNA